MLTSSLLSRYALLCGFVLLPSLLPAAEPAAPYWLPSTNHWAGNTGGKGGIDANADVISNMVVDIAVLNAGDLPDQKRHLAPLVITKSYWDETRWADGAYSAGVRVDKGEFYHQYITFDSSTSNGVTVTIARPHVLDTDHALDDPAITPQQIQDIIQQNAEDQGVSLAAFPDNLPYVAFSDGRRIDSIAYPTSVAFDHDGYLWITDNGPDQNFKIFSVPETGDPFVVATFGETGGVFAGPVSGAVGPLRFWGPRGVGFGDNGEIIVGCSGISGQTQGGTDVRWFQPSDTSSLGGRLATATMVHQALATFVHVADFDPTSNGTGLYSGAVRYKMDYTKPPGQSWSLEGVTLDPFRFPDDPRLHMPLETTYYRIIGGQRFLIGTSMAGKYIAFFRFEQGSEIAIPCALFYTFDSGQGSLWASGKYPTWAGTDENSRRRYSWRDADGDGQVDTGEFTEYRVPGPYSQCYDVDVDGNLWMGGGMAEYSAEYDAGGIWVLPCTGVDESGVPTFDFAAIEKHDLPQSLILPQDYAISYSPLRMRYLADTDTLFLASGMTPQFAGRIYIIDGYRRSGHPTLRCLIDLGFDSNGQIKIHLDQGTDKMVLPMSFAADNDYVYVGYLDRGRNVPARGEVTIYSARDGRQVGWLQPDAGTNWFCGTIDLVVGLQVTTLADGSRLICEEDDGAAKVMVFHWNPKDTGPAVQLQSVSADQAQATLVFGPTVSNRLYDVYASTDLAPNTWTRLNDEPLAGTGSNLEYVDTAATGPRKFYRLQIATPVAPTP